jgi:hypothetical protein
VGVVFGTPIFIIMIIRWFTPEFEIPFQRWIMFGLTTPLIFGSGENIT